MPGPSQRGLNLKLAIWRAEQRIHVTNSTNQTRNKRTSQTKNHQRSKTGKTQ